MLGTSISKNSLLLGLFALVTAAILASTQLATRDRIAAAEREAAQRALFELVPQARIDNDLLNDTLPAPETMLPALGLQTPEPIHRARRDGEVIAVIVPAVAPDGYSGAIRLLVGVNRDGSVAGVRALSHRETPGLGDKIDLAKSDWILTFDGRRLGAPVADDWRVKKDGGVFDQFTGATITPRAVVAQVRRVLEQVQNHRAQLFELPTETTGEPHE